MDPSLQALLARLDHLSEQFQELREGVRKVVRIADEDPEMALTRARKVLEYVVREVYERRVNEPPGTRPLENLLQRLVKDGHFPPLLEAYANSVRMLGNVGTHKFGEKITVAAVYQSLTQLMPILEWYFEVEHPEAAGPHSAPPEPAPVKRSEPPATAAPGTAVAVVPKGLRSFDAKDADFFLDLLPGPRDQDGLPESIRFWKHRVEERDEPTFTVGAIYGPSGCGKSSLVKAGLLPRLAERVLPVYVEATANDTEVRLLKALRKRDPSLPADAGLTATLAALRQGEGAGNGRKVLVVLDQFEQWLHANRGQEQTELAHALRQCDGERVQCVVTVRDDFWLGLSRFMSALHIELLQGQNIALVDLFDPIHARHVLSAFGRAFGRLAAELSREQESFLDQAVAGLSQDGRAISVRLALFAEMVKGRAWTPATLREVGGAAGVGVSFLEETFSSRAASPRHRGHERAVRAVLKALLPEQGSDIKGNMQPHGKLLEVSGYARRAGDFEELLRILDGEVRLITPTDPETSEPAALARDSSSPLANAAGSEQGRYYQLTHDYLVPSLREWLTRKQRETRRGRAELRLAERAALWSGKPESRHLPAWWEWLNIRLLTRKKDWTPPQKRMMRKAARHHLLRGAVLAVALAALAFAGLAVRDRVVADNNATRAAGLVRSLRDADTAQVSGIVAELERYRPWADPLLRQENEQAADDSRQKLNTALALLPVEDGQVEYLYQRLLSAAPPEVPVLRDALALHQEGLRERLWAAAERPPAGQEGQRLRAASALAAYDADDGRWDGVRDAVAADLVAVPAVHLADWMKALSPVRERLLPPLAAIFRDTARPQSERALATEVLVEYAADRPELLADLLMDADERQWARLWPKAEARREPAIARFTQELDRTLAPKWQDDKPLDPSPGQPDAALVSQVEAAAGLVAERFALCQALPLAEFDAVAEGLGKAGYRPVNFRPYAHQPDARAREASPSVLVAALWMRDGREARWAHGLTADEAAKRDAEERGKGLVPLDVAGYLAPGDAAAGPRYAVLWGPKEDGTDDVKMYVGVTAARHSAAWQPLQKGGFVPHTQSRVLVEGAARYSAVWWKPARTLETKVYNFSYSEEQYEEALSPSNLQLDLRLALDPAGMEKPRRLGAAALAVAPGAGMGGVPWAALALGNAAAEAGPPGLEFAANWIDSVTDVSEEVHGLDPAAHLARCRDLAAKGYRPAALTVVEVGGGRLLSGSVWQRPVVPEAAKDALAKRQAQAAVALLRLGAPARVWPLLEHTPDPRVRSFVIHRLRPLAADPDLLLQRLEEEREVSRRRALVLGLGGYPVDALEGTAREKWLPRLRQWYRDEPDAGLHGAVEWLLRRWGEGAEVGRIEQELARKEKERPLAEVAPKQWYVNGENQTLVMVPEPAPFWMGSPGHEAGRIGGDTEPLHRVCIPRSFAIVAKEVTMEQFRKFKANHRYTVKYSPRDDGPIVSVTWYQAAEYCNLLSEQEGIPKKEWCYEPNEDGEYAAGMRLVPGALEKRGYRLPTEAEWEYACRAGAVTRRYYGEADELLGEYAWYGKTTNDESTRAGGLLKPNDLGLFDLYGNALEWVQDPAFVYDWPRRGEAKEDKIYIKDIKGIEEGTRRLLRGGSFNYSALDVRSAGRNTGRPSSEIYTVGFRVARTYR